MKRLDNTELQEQALKVAEAHGVNSVFATADGNYFLPKDKSYAFDYNAKVIKKEFDDAEVLEVIVPKAAEAPLNTAAAEEAPLNPAADNTNPIVAE